MKFSQSLKNLVPSLRDHVVATLVALEDHTAGKKLGKVKEQITSLKAGQLGDPRESWTVNCVVILSLALAFLSLSCHLKVLACVLRAFDIALRCRLRSNLRSSGIVWV